MKSTLKIVLTFVLCTGLGIWLSRLAIDNWLTVKQAFVSKQHLYYTSDAALESEFIQATPIDLNWAHLMPEEDHQVIARYQQNSEPQNLEQMTAKVMRSINAAKDQQYQNALISTNTMAKLADKMINISGFIVPIDFYEDQSVQSFFFVPYFGACIHLPAPPPNQMIFVQLERGFKGLDITNTYTLTGKLHIELFEDLMGTSAYTLELVSIVPFYGKSNDFRSHNIN